MDEIRTHTILNNRYEVQRELGRGGMGAVYLAQDQRYRKPVAIKVARLASPEARAQFRREADYLQKLHHHSLPRVWETFSDTQREFLVMEYIPDDDLETLVQRKGPQPEWQVLRWADELLDALAFLHTQTPPIIHRDIKPGNLKLRGDGSLVLVDFGIAKEYLPGANTYTGATAVTPGFSPPEQYTDSLTDARSDLYAVGATMYFLLTGVAPVPAPARAAGDQKLPPPSQLVPSISTGAELVVRKALILVREQRWSSAAEMRQMVDEAAQRLATPRAARRQVPPPVLSAGRRATPPAPREAPSWPPLAGLFVGIVVVATLAALFLTRLGGSRAANTPTPSTVAAVDATVTEGAATMDVQRVTPTQAPSETPSAASMTAAQAPTASGDVTTSALASGDPTSTPLPTYTPTPIVRTPTLQPKRNATVGPATIVAPRSSPSAPGSVTVTLLVPNESETRSGDTIFRWQVTGDNLLSGQSFEVFCYKPGADPLAYGFGLAAPTTSNVVTVDLAALDADPSHPLDPGEWLWSVRLVQGARPLRVLAEGRRLIYQRPPPTPEPAPPPTIVP